MCTATLRHGHRDPILKMKFRLLIGSEVIPNFLYHWEGHPTEYHTAILEDKTLLIFPHVFKHTLDFLKCNVHGIFHHFNEITIVKGKD